jgi:hypothetical protein
LFPKEQKAVSMLFCLLAAMIERPIYLERALECLSAREQESLDEFQALNIHFQGALAAFAAGDVARAIDIGEASLATARKLKALPTTNQTRIQSFIFSISSDLAYYHADLLGSHEGEKRKSKRRARAYLKSCIALYHFAQIPKLGLKAKQEDILNALKTALDPLRVFFALDNEVYVMIQTADSISELRDIKKRLEFLHQHVPPEGIDAARLAIDYNEYCWRQRLADLEGNGSAT